MTDQTPPHDDHAEQALLGAMLQSPLAVTTAITHLNPVDLYRPRHQLIYNAIVDTDPWGDPVLVAHELSKRGHLAKTGGTPYLHTCIATAGAGAGPDTISAYAAIITEHAHTRTRTETALRLRQAATDPDAWHRILQDAHDNLNGHQPTTSTELAKEIATQRLRRQARRTLDTEDHPPTPIPDILTLTQRLAQPLPPITWRINGWQPANSRVILSAQYKYGKTSLVGNLIRCLVDGDHWLGAHPVTTVTGTIALIDTEMTARQLDQWLRAQHITHTDQVLPIPLLGTVSAFNILNPDIADTWAQLLAKHNVEYLILDCLRPVLDSCGLNEHTEAGRLLVAYDQLLNKAGIPDSLIVHHMGHTGERARGDSRLRDWPDVEWRGVREDPDDPASPRYLSAYGRDVDQTEIQLGYDTTTHHLRTAGGTRADAAIRTALTDIHTYLDTQPGASGRQIETALRDTHPQNKIRAALKAGIDDGSVLTLPGGNRGAIRHYHEKQD